MSTHGIKASRHPCISASSEWGDAETVQLLIEHGASVNAYDKNHQTPLHRLSSCDDPNADCLRLLLENGADVDVEDDEGLTAIQIASSKENSSSMASRDRTVVIRSSCPYRVEYDVVFQRLACLLTDPEPETVPVID